MKIFVVAKIGWEYNDQNYFRPESGGVVPVKGFSTKVKAQAECDRLNATCTHLNSEYYVDEENNPITSDYEVVALEMETTSRRLCRERDRLIDNGTEEMED